MFFKQLQLALIHTAVAMTLVPINSTLNRVMIKELAISAALVAALASLPYLISPIQVWIGSFADRHTLAGLRRTPYIALGLLLCTAGVILAPQAAFRFEENFWAGLGVGLLAFSAWGMGYNLSAVSYLALATEISGEKGRSRTVAIMFTLMIIGIITTSIVLSRMLDPYSPQALERAFRIIGLAALILGMLGLVRLESRQAKAQPTSTSNYTLQEMRSLVTGNPQVRLFFIYLILLLAAILGQDILLEPFAAEAFAMPVEKTTRITSIWGACFLASLLAAGALEGKAPKRLLAQVGGWGALAGFVVIASSGIAALPEGFYLGLVLLGLGSGIATVSNLSLMLDMTTPERVGLYMGAWGMANALSRLTGSLFGGALRDALNRILLDPVLAYGIVFFCMALMMLASLLLLTRIDVGVFQQRAQQKGSAFEIAALSD